MTSDVTALPPAAPDREVCDLGRDAEVRALPVRRPLAEIASSIVPELGDAPTLGAIDAAVLALEDTILRLGRASDAERVALAETADRIGYQYGWAAILTRLSRFCDRVGESCVSNEDKREAWRLRNLLELQASHAARREELERNGGRILW